MKKLLLLAAAFLLGTISTSFAQRQKMTESYGKETGYGGFVLRGNKTYYYVVGEDGSHLMDGTYTISCPQATTSVSIWPHNYKITGSYSMTANHSKGNLHGTVSSNYKIAITGSNGQADNEYATLSGNFTNGIPNGKFVVNSKGSNFATKLNATYNNGVLVGAFSCQVMGDEGLPHNYTGTLTTQGKLSGTWTYQSGISQGSMLFQNGVLISKNDTNEGKSTPPAMQELAKQYAAGTITKEALAEKGYSVLRGEITLGDYACTCITGRAGVDFSELGGYHFEQMSVSYEYLDQVCYLNKEGVEKLITDLVNHGECRFDNNSASSNAKYDCIDYDNDGKPYIKIHQMNKQYVSGLFDSYVKDVYIKDEDMAYIDAKIAESAKPLLDFVHNSNIRGIGGPGITAEMNELHRLQNLLEMFNTEKIKISEEVYLFKKVGGFISASSVKEVEKAIEEMEIKIEQQKLTRAFEFIQSRGKAYPVVSDVNAGRYLIGYKNLDAEKIMKPFCPMVAYEIINMDKEHVTCKWSVQGKKNGISTYELTLKHKQGRLVIDAESFNITTAKKIE